MHSKTQPRRGPGCVLLYLYREYMPDSFIQSVYILDKKCTVCYNEIVHDVFAPGCRSGTETCQAKLYFCD